VLDKIQAILRDVFEDDSLVAEPGLKIRELPKWDSFNHINMMIALEESFGVIIAPRNAERIFTVSDLASVLEENGVSA
jgi:acyl carrier protein